MIRRRLWIFTCQFVLLIIVINKFKKYFFIYFLSFHSLLQVFEIEPTNQGQMAKFSVGKLEEGGSSRRTPKRPRTDGDGATVEEYPPDPDYRQYLSAEYDVFDSDEEEVDQDNNNDGERMQETEQPETQETEKDEDVVSNDDRVAGRDGSAFTVSDLDVLDCFVCYYPLTIPVFQVSFLFLSEMLCVFGNSCCWFLCFVCSIVR